MRWFSARRAAGSSKGRGRGRPRVRPRKRQRVSSFAQARAARAPPYRGGPAAGAETQSSLGCRTGEGVAVTAREGRAPWSRGLCRSRPTNDGSGFQGAVRPAFLSIPASQLLAGRAAPGPVVPTVPPPSPRGPHEGCGREPPGGPCRVRGWAQSGGFPRCRSSCPQTRPRGPRACVCVCSAPGLPSRPHGPRGPRGGTGCSLADARPRGSEHEWFAGPNRPSMPLRLQHVPGPAPSAVAAAAQRRLGVPGPAAVCSPRTPLPVGGDDLPPAPGGRARARSQARPAARGPDEQLGHRDGNGGFFKSVTELHSHTCFGHQTS